MMTHAEIMNIQNLLCEKMDAYNAAKAADPKSPETEAADAAFSEALQKYTGPSFGMYFDNDAREIKPAAGYAFDDAGNLYDRDAVTGPGVQK